MKNEKIVNAVKKIKECYSELSVLVGGFSSQQKINFIYPLYDNLIESGFFSNNKEKEEFKHLMMQQLDISI